MKKITPCLWFNDKAEEAVNFYASIFKDAKIKNVARYSEAAAKVAGRPAGSVVTVSFEIAGQSYLALNGGPIFKFTEAVSFIVNCETQEEVDYYWEKLTEGGDEVQCGWLKDKYGLSWQITPTALGEMMSGKEPAKTERMMMAMFQMKKLEIKKLKEAYEG